MPFSSGSDQKKVLETARQGPFPVRSWGPLLFSASLLSLALLFPLTHCQPCGPAREA